MKNYFLKSIFLFFIFCGQFLAAQQTPNLIPYRKAKLWGYCHPDKKIIIPIRFQRAFPFVNGKAIVEAGKDSVLQIDTNGKILQIIPYHMNDYITERGMMRISSLDWEKTGLMDISGKIILSPIYIGVEVLGKDSFEVILPGKKGVINSQQKVLVKFEPYDSDSYPGENPDMIMNNICEHPCFYQPFSEHLAVVAWNSKFGYGDTTNSIVIPCKYFMAESFMYGLGRVMFEKPGQKTETSTVGKDGVINAVATIIEEGYVDKNGTEYWED